MKLKKVLSIFIIMNFLVHGISYADTDVNTDSSDVSFGGQAVGDENLYWDSTVRGTRVSLWNIETQTLIYKVNMCDFSQKPYSVVSNFNILSNLTKPEIIDLNYELSVEMKKNIYIPLKVKSVLCKESVAFPELFARNGVSAEERTKKIKEFYKDDTKANILLKQFGDKITEEEKKLWEDDKAVLLLEPLITIHTNDNSMWLLTCAELGLLALNGFAKSGEMFASGKLSATGYKALPYGTYKEKVGLIKKIKKYQGNSSIMNACSTPADFRKMVDMLGCLELSNIKMTHSTEEKKTGNLEYYTNTWVITSVDIESENGFPYQSRTPRTNQDLPAKNNCLNDGLAEITFNFNNNDNIELNTHSYTQSIAIPENGNAISWVKWKTPKKPCNVELHIKTNSSDAKPENDIIYIEIIDPYKNNSVYPPQTKATDRNDGFKVPKVAKGEWDIGNTNSLSWITYDYNWHYFWVYGCGRTMEDNCLTEYDYYSNWDEDYVCNAHECPEDSEEHECPTGMCSDVRQDWGWVEWTPVYHTVSLNSDDTDLRRSEHTPNTNDSDYSIKSGYGIELEVKSKMIYKRNDSKKNISSIKNAVIPPQFMQMYMPEFEYKEYEIISYNDLDDFGYKENNIFSLPTCPYSQFEQKCHFTPIWYPDGDYVVGIKITQSFCPAGMLYNCIYDTKININGNVYDDWHIAPQKTR